MARLIDATRIEQYILNNCSDIEEINAIYAEIINAPTVDAEPVRHGHWENYLSEGLRWKCSECGSRFETPYHYCPNCGAMMDEEGEDEK